MYKHEDELLLIHVYKQELVLLFLCISLSLRTPHHEPMSPLARFVLRQGQTDADGRTDGRTDTFGGRTRNCVSILFVKFQAKESIICQEFILFNGKESILLMTSSGTRHKTKLFETYFLMGRFEKKPGLGKILLKCIEDTDTDT